ncbi:MAG: hypothetical protein WCR52_09020, partial [Bacteroidota bacterium]
MPGGIRMPLLVDTILDAVPMPGYFETGTISDSVICWVSGWAPAGAPLAGAQRDAGGNTDAVIGGH